MSSSRKSSLRTIECREAFGRITRLVEVPVGFFEAAGLAGEIEHPKARVIEQIMTDIIAVMLDDPEASIKLQNLAANGYQIRFSATENAG